MSTQPQLTFQQNVTPYSTITSETYQSTSPSGAPLPVLQGTQSNHFYFRVYNNWALAAGIATAVNVFVTTYDGIGTGSHTAFKAVVSQTWIHMLENGYGESAGTPGPFTSYIGSDTNVGGVFVYNPEVGSNGVSLSQIRAGSNQAGVGFIEFQSYAYVPTNATNNTSTFSISVGYEWTS
jgi:hypothetical protein